MPFAPNTETTLRVWDPEVYHATPLNQIAPTLITVRFTGSVLTELKVNRASVPLPPQVLCSTTIQYLNTGNISWPDGLGRTTDLSVVAPEVFSRFQQIMATSQNDPSVTLTPEQFRIALSSLFPEEPQDLAN